MKRILAYLFFCFPLFAFSQDALIQLDTISFIRYDADTLAFDMNNSKLPHFYAKLDSVITHKQGNINIIQIGGSHIQAGVLSNTIRKNILLTYPDLISGRGFIFPYSVAPKCNNPSDYKIRKKGTFSLVRNVYKTHDKDLNTSGIAVYTNDTFPEIFIKLNDSIPYRTQKITVVGKATPQENFPTIWVDSSEYFPTEIDTINNRFIYFVNMTDSFTLQMHCNGDSTQEFILNSIFLENDLPGITFHSIGVNGASVDSYLRCVDFERDLDLFKPDLVIFCIGINDAATNDFNPELFVSNYLDLVQKFERYNPDCAYIFFSNNDSYKRISRRNYRVNKNGLKVQELVYSIAEQTKGAVFDQFNIMGGLYSMGKWYSNKLAKYDRVHFTNEGYKMMGNLFFNAFMQSKYKCENTNNQIDINNF